RRAHRGDRRLAANRELRAPRGALRAHRPARARVRAPLGARRPRRLGQHRAAARTRRERPERRSAHAAEAGARRPPAGRVDSRTGVAEGGRIMSEVGTPPSTTSDDLYEHGARVLAELVGPERARATGDPLMDAFRDLIQVTVVGAVWGRPGLD